MSMCEKEEIQCPVCGTTGEFEMWKSVNTVLNPEKKEELLNGALFQYICPHCGKSYNIDYSIRNAASRGTLPSEAVSLLRKEIMKFRRK